MYSGSILGGRARAVTSCFRWIRINNGIVEVDACGNIYEQSCKRSNCNRAIDRVIIRETIIDHSLFIYPYLHNMGIPGVEDILYCNTIHPPSLLGVFQY